MSPRESVIPDESFPQSCSDVSESEEFNYVLQELKALGNTVVVVEHDEEIMNAADYIIDIGPLGGDNGGEIVATGTPEEVSKNKKSYTGEFLKRIL